MEKILVIDDDPAVQRVLRRTFEGNGFDVVVAQDGTLAMGALRASKPHLIILDLRLPGKSGLELRREIKQQSPSLPIMVLSALCDVVNKVLLLDLGADDYVTKPFSPRELLARARVAVRRLHQEPSKPEVFRFGDIEVNFSAMELHRDGRCVPMTAQEFKLIHFFLKNEEPVVSRSELLNEIWAIRAILQPELWIPLCFACGTSSNPISPNLSIYEPCMVQAISSSARLDRTLLLSPSTYIDGGGSRLQAPRTRPDANRSCLTWLASLTRPLSVSPPFGSECLTSRGPGRRAGQSRKELGSIPRLRHLAMKRQATEVSAHELCESRQLFVELFENSLPTVLDFILRPSGAQGLGQVVPELEEARIEHAEAFQARLEF